MSPTEIKIKKHLESGRSLTTLGALRLYGTLRLPEFVRRLRNDHGMKIVCTRIRAGEKWFGKYTKA